MIQITYNNADIYKDILLIASHLIKNMNDKDIQVELGEMTMNIMTGRLTVNKKLDAEIITKIYEFYETTAEALYNKVKNYMVMNTKYGEYSLMATRYIIDTHTTQEIIDITLMDEDEQEFKESIINSLLEAFKMREIIEKTVNTLKREAFTLDELDEEQQIRDNINFEMINKLLGIEEEENNDGEYDDEDKAYIEFFENNFYDTYKIFNIIVNNINIEKIDEIINNIDTDEFENYEEEEEEED